jgi:phosphoribosylamine--glycine ligase
MGAVSPSTEVDAALERTIMERVVLPAVRGMAAEGTPYRGVLYAGLMLVHGPSGIEPMTLEFNARFGDPEAQVLLPRLETDLVPLLAGAAGGRLPAGPDVLFGAGASACVVLAAQGYPGRPRTGDEVRGLDDAVGGDRTLVFHAGTRVEAAPGGGRRVVTSGGRVLAVAGLGPDLGAAVRRAYEGVARISFEGMHHRRDIGRDALERLETRARQTAHRGGS